MAVEIVDVRGVSVSGLALDPGGSTATCTIDRLTLLDVVQPPSMNDPRVTALAGDIADRTLLERLIDTRTSSIFHLAAIVSGQAEADFDLGMRVNFDATRTILEICRARGHRPRVVFASSCAV